MIQERSFVGATPFFTLNWSKYEEFFTFHGGLDPIDYIGSFL
jgi:hypothetical protein